MGRLNYPVRDVLISRPKCRDLSVVSLRLRVDGQKSRIRECSQFHSGWTELWKRSIIV